MSRDRKIRILTACKTCGKEFASLASAKRQYCSSACAYKSFDRVRHVKPKNRGVAVCNNCKKEFSIKTGSGKALYCSRFCAHSSIGKTTLLKNRKLCRSRGRYGWRVIGEKRVFLRSSWEKIYAEHLETLKRNGTIAEWRYEPVAFNLGFKFYIPDFQVILQDGKTEYHEVKGWMDNRSKININYMAKIHPDVVLRVITNVKNLT